MKFSRDPLTGYPTVQIADRTIVLQKDTASPEEAMHKPAREVIECAI